MTRSPFSYCLPTRRVLSPIVSLHFLHDERPLRAISAIFGLRGCESMSGEAVAERSGQRQSEMVGGFLELLFLLYAVPFEVL